MGIGIIALSLAGDMVGEKLLGQAGMARLSQAMFVYKLTKALTTTIAGETERIAGELADDIRDAVPEDTGELRDSVRVRKARKRGYHVIEGGTPETMRGTFDLALAIEYGTMKTPAQPHFWPAVNAKEEEVEDAIFEAVDEEVSA